MDIQSIRDRLNQASVAYYVYSDPIMSDQEYDELFHQLVLLEKQYPSLQTADSPTLRVGSDLDVDAVRVPHVRSILSLENAFSEEKLRAWQTRNATLVRPPSMSMTLGGSDSLGYIVTPKLDGLSLIVTYKDGVMVQAVTRGNGEEGDDVTANAKTIRNLPLALVDSEDYSIPRSLVVRGEVVIHKDDFARYNETAQITAANPRNLASGSIKQKRSSEVAKRPLRFYAFDVVDMDGCLPSDKFSSFNDMLSGLASWGFSVVPMYHLDTLNDVIESLKVWDKTRFNFPYEMDGIVIKYNHLHYYEKLGYIAKDPRGAIAYKYPSMQVTTKLKGVKISVGRTGVIQPTADLEPIAIGGVTVTSASLHNYEQIEALDFRVGDQVILKRGGEVIPYLVAPVISARKGIEKKITPPVNCPHCQTPIEKIGVRYFCTNLYCPERTVRLLEYWGQRENLSIEGLGEMTARMLAGKVVKSVADLYTLTVDDLIVLQGMGAKRAEALIEAIGKSVSATWDVVLAALGIDGVGHSTCEQLFENYESLWALEDISADRLMKDVYGIGEVTAQTIVSWFSNADNLQILKGLEAAGFNFKSDRVASGLSLLGKKFVVTGTLSVTRPEIEKYIRDNGGVVVSSISKKVHYLVAGSNAGSKLEKARQLGVGVITEAQLMGMAKTVSTPFDE